MAENGEWMIDSEGEPFVTRDPDPVNRTPAQELESGIESMVNDMKSEGDKVNE